MVNNLDNGLSDPLHLEFTCDEALAGERLDKGISLRYPDISRSHISNLIRSCAVTLNAASPKPSSRLSAGDLVVIDLPEEAVPDIVAEDIPLDILYEDADVAVINKPKGMVVHPSCGHFTGTLVNALMFHIKDLSGINGVLRPGIVHRIDRDTTGSLIICKNDKAHISLAEQLKNHSLNRTYVAIVRGNIREDEGTVDAPIGRSVKDRKKMAVVPGGRRAVTHFKVLERFGEYTYIECRLETGRTHQIRVHMSHIGHPVLGDEVYSGGKSKFNTSGQVLHAKTLGFIQPSTGKYIEVEAPVPEYFNKILENLR